MFIVVCLLSFYYIYGLILNYSSRSVNNLDRRFLQRPTEVVPKQEEVGASRQVWCYHRAIGNNCQGRRILGRIRWGILVTILSRILAAIVMEIYIYYTVLN